MNEAQVLMYLLTKKDSIESIGSTEDELLKKLSLTDKNAKSKLLNLLEELDTTILPLGLNIKFNPGNKHWFISYRDSLVEVTEGSNIPGLPSIYAATLFSILVIGMTGPGIIKKKEIIDLRNKKNIDEDLDQLEILGFISISNNDIRIMPKIFYHVDLEELLDEVKKISAQSTDD